MIKSELIRDTIKRSYPYIGILKDSRDAAIIVLFYSYNTGTCLCKDNSSISQTNIGEFTSTWYEEKFVPLEGKLILSNE